MEKIKVFLDLSEKSQRNKYNLLSRLLWNENNTENSSNECFEVPNFTLAKNVEESDVCVLPLLWNYYIENKYIGNVEKLYDESVLAGKPFIIFSEGDFTANIPFPNVYIFQKSCYRSRDGLKGQKLFTIPPIISDYLSLYCNNEMQYRELSNNPTVGFCGQSTGNFFDYIRRKSFLQYKRIKFKLGFEKWEPPPIEPSSYRNRILRKISENSEINTNYLMRSKYRAGYRPKTKKDPFHPTRVEFIQNILNSDYTVCMRGGGNFSVRLYETLSLGRIPIFIDSDSPLPFEEFTNYKDYFIYIKEDEMNNISDKILSFHRSLSSNEFKDYQKKCYDLWVSHFSQIGYLQNLQKLIMEVIINEKTNL
jgi:hypothetical protein